MSDPSAPGEVPVRQPRSWTERERIREGVLMALYIGLSLLAVLVVSPTPDAESAREVALTVLLTALGLVMAHQVAFRLATRLVSQGELDDEARAAMRAQRVGGLLVAIAAAVPVLLLGGRTGLVVSEWLMLGLVAVVGYAVARASGRSRLVALLYVAALSVVVGVVLVVKLAVGH